MKNEKTVIYIIINIQVGKIVVVNIFIPCRPPSRLCAYIDVYLKRLCLAVCAAYQQTHHNG